ncbi:MAG: ABC transporter permease [Saprospiraceae bacterium]|nr:ABC transporter permease [Saprospiraceae bacterium]
MIQNYLRIAFRNLWKTKGITLINIAGLSAGMACFALLLLHVNDEFSFDRFHANKDHVYRVLQHSRSANGDPAHDDAYMPMPLGPAMQADLPDVTHYVRFCDWGDQFVRSPRQTAKLPVLYADPQIFEVFTFPLRYGNSGTALSELNSVVLTEHMAQQLFGEENPTGKTLDIKVMDDFEPFLVTGVAQNLPSNSSIRFGILCSYARHAATKWGKRNEGNWNRSSYQTFVALRPGSGLSGDSARLQQFWNKYYPDQEANMRNEGRWKGEGPPMSYRLQSLKNMHTEPGVFASGAPAFNPRYGWILLGLGGLVLLIACINFTTLAIGRSAGRAREIGVRKVIGAFRRQLVGQFLAESLLLSAISMILAIGLAYLLLPALNELTDKQLHFDLSQYPELGWMFPALTLLAGLLAGAYPALVLSGFRPLEVLRSKFRVAGANIFTKSLVSVQFILSVGLIACTLVMVRQLQYLLTRDPGFNKANVMIVNAEDTDAKQLYPRFRAAVAGQPGIAGIAASELSLGAGTGWNQNGFSYNGEPKEVYEYFVDPDYIPVLGMELLAGRNFDYAYSTDTLNAIVINESMMRDFGWTLDNAVGQPLRGFRGDSGNDPVVIGVVRDFNYLSMHGQVQPMMFHMFSDYAPYQIFVRLQAGRIAEGIAAAETAWKDLSPELPFQYAFLDENLSNFYISEARWSRIVGYAGALAILLACLGLFGLAALAAVNRTKEIGIRKVLGASIFSITGLLSKEFILLVLIAIAVATPLAYWVMAMWLRDFAFRIDVQWWVFALAGLASIGVALLTVGFQSYRAAVANPAESLKSE